MGIRYEKDTILNWVNEMGKFLRLLVDKWEGKLTDLDVAPAYKAFFELEREAIIDMDDYQLVAYAASLEQEQIRPMAQMMLYDGLISGDKAFIRKAKVLFEYHMKSSGSFSFEDYGILAQIDKELK